MKKFNLSFYNWDITLKEMNVKGKAILFMP